MASNRKHQRTTQEQLQFYLVFCKEHPELQMGKNNPRAPRAIQQLWCELASNLNGMRGPTRTPGKWKKNLSQWKNQLRCRARKARVHRLTICGGPQAQELSLSEKEQQATARFGKSAVYGNKNVTSLGFQAVYDFAAGKESEAGNTSFEEGETDFVAMEEIHAANATVSREDVSSATEDVFSSEAIPSTFSARKHVTCQLLHDELKNRTAVRNEMEERSLMLQERSLALQEQMLQKQQETNAALKKIGEAILALAEAVAKR